MGTFLKRAKLEAQYLLGNKLFLLVKPILTGGPPSDPATGHAGLSKWKDRCADQSRSRASSQSTRDAGLERRDGPWEKRDSIWIVTVYGGCSI